MRKGIKPPATPKPGSFWRHKVKVRPTGEATPWFDIVAVMDVKSGYARMGMRSDIVEYTSGLAYAVNDGQLQGRYKKTLARNSFFEYFEEMTDTEEISEILGMHALTYYG